MSQGGAQTSFLVIFFYALDEVQGVEALLHPTALGLLGLDRKDDELLLSLSSSDECVSADEEISPDGSVKCFPLSSVLQSLTEMPPNYSPRSQQVQPQLQTCIPTKSPQKRESRTKNTCGAKSINPSNLSPKPQQEGANYPTAN